MNSQTLEAEALKINKAVAFQIKGETVTIDRCITGGISAKQDAAIGAGGALGIAVGRDLTMGSGGAQFLAVGRDMNFKIGGAQFLTAGQNVTFETGGAQIMTAGHDLTCQQGGGVLMVAQTVKAANARVGVVLARKAEFSEGSRVLINTPQALLIGLLVGAVAALFQLFARRSR